MLLLPWSETGSISEAQTISTDSVRNKLESDSYSAFISQALATAQCHTAIFINKGFSGSLRSRPSALERKMSTLSLRSHRELQLPNVDSSHHIFLPFFGGADGRVALRLVLQLAENPEVTATLLYLSAGEAGAKGSESSSGTVEQTAITTKGTPAGRHENDAAFFATLSRSLPDELQSRVIMDSVTTATPIQDAVARAQREVGQAPKNGGDVIVLGRHASALPQAPETQVLGVSANAFIGSGIRSSLLVVQASGSGFA
jgi:hypothetical protein